MLWGRLLGDHPGLLVHGRVREQRLQPRVGFRRHHHGQCDCLSPCLLSPRRAPVISWHNRKRGRRGPPPLLAALIRRGRCAQYSLNADLAAGSTLNLDLKVDKLLPLKTTCPMCGGNCTIDIPVIKQKVSFAMPPCPIAKGSGALNSTKLTLPADPLKSGKVSIDGSISVTDSNQQLVASVQLDLAIE